MLAAGARPPVYSVKQKDTLSGIASRFKMQLSEVEALNSGINPDEIAPGQILRLTPQLQKTGDIKAQVANGWLTWSPVQKVPLGVRWFIGMAVFGLVVFFIVSHITRVLKWIEAQMSRVLKWIGAQMSRVQKKMRARKASAATIPLFQSPGTLPID